MGSRRIKKTILVLLVLVGLVGTTFTLQPFIITIITFLIHVNILKLLSQFLGIKVLNLDTIKTLVSQLMVFLGSVLVIITIVRIIQVNRGPGQLVIEKFKDLSGFKFTESQVMSFSLEMREQLVEAIRRINHRIKNHSEGDGPETYSAPLPSAHVSDAEQRLENITDTPGTSTPQQIAWVISLANLLKKVRYTRVVCNLQRTGCDGCLAFTFEIVDTSGKTKPDIYTVDDKVVKDHMAHHLEAPNDLGNLQRPNDTKQVTLSLIALNGYRTLLQTAINSLAIELCKREMFAHVPLTCRILRRKKRYQAQVYNFIGALYAAHARNDNSFYYGRAIHNFKQAIEFDRRWNLPYANLADVYSVKGQQSCSQESIELQHTALDEYDRALQYIPPSLLWEITKKLWIREKNEGKRVDKHRNRIEKILRLMLMIVGRMELNIRARIIIGRARVELLIGGARLIKHARQDIAIVEDFVNLTNLTDPRVLYYLACWYAIAYEIVRKDEAEKDKARDYQGKACYYLACCLARNTEDIFDEKTIEDTQAIEDLDWYYWKRALNDRDLENIRESVISIQQVLKNEHRQKMLDPEQSPHPLSSLSMTKLKKDSFQKMIKEVLVKSSCKVA